MKFKVGDVVVVPTSLDDTKLREYIISRIPTSDTVECGSRENTFYTAFVWPVDMKEELLEVLSRRKHLKQTFEESMGLLYELRNKLSRRT